MERQYIGARYVPKFWDNGSGSTEWTPNIPYESMVVVTYMNNSYTSKVPVPATQVTPNIDTEHWALTGAYNAQVEQYRQETKNLGVEVSTIKTDVNTLNYDVDNLKKEIPGIDNTKVLLIGDSLNLDNGWGAELANLANLNATIIGNGSAGFVSAGGTAPYTGMNMLQTVQAATQSMTEEDKKSYKYVVIGCGVNDYSADVDQLRTNVAAFFDFVKQNFINAKIFFFLDHTFKPISASTKAKYEAINEVALSKRIIVNTDLSVVCFDNIEWNSDMVHMTPNGYKAYAKKIYNAINGGTVLENRLVEVTPVDNSQISIIQNRSTIKGGILHLSFALEATKALSPGPAAIFTVPQVSHEIGHGWVKPLLMANNDVVDKNLWVSVGGKYRATVSIDINTLAFIDICFDATMDFQ